MQHPYPIERNITNKFSPSTKEEGYYIILFFLKMDASRAPIVSLTPLIYNLKPKSSMTQYHVTLQSSHELQECLRG